MTRKLAFLVVCVALLTCQAQSGLASEVYYLTVRSGSSDVLDAVFNDLIDDPDLGEMDVSFESGSLAAAAFGWSFQDGRMELEATQREADVGNLGSLPAAGNRFSVRSLMFNGYYDIETWSSWNPYVGLGFGGAFVSVEEGGGEDDDFVLAYQAGGGVAFKLSESLSVDLQYWFFITSEYELLTTSSEYADLFQSHNVSVGLRYVFE